MGLVAIAQQSIVAATLRRAARPRGSDPAGVAVALGYRPRALVAGPLRASRADALPYRWSPDPAARARGIWIALAHALLAQSIGPHQLDQAERLADALAAAHAR